MSEFLSQLDNRMNPIVVKELRQGMQSRFVVIVVNLLLFALSMAYLLTIMLNPALMEDATGGKVLFGIFLGGLVLASSLGVPIYMIARLCSERNGTNVDLFFTTSLGVHQIIRGKFIAGMTLVTLLYSICLPFMLCTNLLRGFDVPTMLYTLVLSYSITILTVMIAIAIGSWSLPKVLTPFVIFVSLIFLFVFNVILTWSFVGVLLLGIQALFRGNIASILVGVVAHLVFLFLIAKLIGSLAVGLLSSPSSNRTRPLRVWGSITIVATLGILLFSSAITTIINSGDWKEIFTMLFGAAIFWLILSTLFLSGMMVVAMCEPDGFSRRIMKDRPPRTSRRGIAFLYTYGASGGFAWAILHAIGVWLLMLFFSFFQSSLPSLVHNAISDTLAWCVLFFCCISCYVFLTKVLMRTVLKPIPTKFAWAPFLALISFLPIAAMVLSFAINFSGWHDSLLWKLFLPIPDFMGEGLSVRLIITIMGAAVMALTALPVGVRDLERYTCDAQLPEPSPVNSPILATIVDSDRQAESPFEFNPVPEPE